MIQSRRSTPISREKSICPPLCNLLSELGGRGIKKFIFTSTCSNYGILEGNQPATETSQLNPRSVYAETKVAFEEFLARQSGSLDFSTTVLRLATAFGLSSRMRST